MTATEQACKLITDSCNTLAFVLAALHTEPSRARKKEIARLLSGVLADVEIVRLAVKS